MKNCAGRIAAPIPGSSNSMRKLPRPRSTFRTTVVAKSDIMRARMLACGRFLDGFL